MATASQPWPSTVAAPVEDHSTASWRAWEGRGRAWAVVGEGRPTRLQGLADSVGLGVGYVTLGTGAPKETTGFVQGVLLRAPAAAARN